MIKLLHGQIFTQRKNDGYTYVIRFKSHQQDYLKTITTEYEKFNSEKKARERAMEWADKLGIVIRT